MADFLVDADLFVDAVDAAVDAAVVAALFVIIVLLFCGV